MMILTLVAATSVFVGATAAFAFPETPYPGRPDFGETCWNTNCHAVPNDDGTGPHGNYSATSNVCSLCHDVHVASAAGVKLLPKATVTAMCLMCHDGTGSPGSGVYGAIIGRGLVVESEHSVITNAASIIPGGDPTGGPAPGTFSENGLLGCGDCHSVHGANTVARYAGERSRFSTNDIFRNSELRSTRLLKKQPTGAAAPVSEYGSDWCLGCHKGRGFGSGHAANHPVETIQTAAPGQPYVYDRVPRMASDTALTEQVLGSMGRIGVVPEYRVRHNRAFVMPWPRTALQQGHYPICMQCHEDPRNVGAVGAITPAVVSGPDGFTATDNPRFQNFPHESTSRNFLVESDDDLCLNCHPQAQLP